MKKLRKVSKEDWIILRLLRHMGKTSIPSRALRDSTEVANYWVNKYGWKTFDAAVGAIERDEA